VLMSMCVCCCLQATHGCGDLVFSSHTTFVLTGVLTFTEYGETLLIKARHGLVGACGVCDCEPRAMVALTLRQDSVDGVMGTSLCLPQPTLAPGRIRCERRSLLGLA
jgi:hypothetical protein